MAVDLVAGKPNPGGNPGESSGANSRTKHRVSPRALVVDDEPAIAEMITTALQDEGWEASTAGSATEVFEWIRRESFGLLVLDVMLPDMDGIMVHSRVRSLDPELARRTIFISAWARTPEVRDY